MLIFLYGIYLPRFKGSECLVFFKSVVLALSTHHPLRTGEAKFGAIVFKACIFVQVNHGVDAQNGKKRATTFYLVVS